MPSRRLVPTFLLLTSLGACGAEPALRADASGDPLGARRALEAQQRQGPVPLEVIGAAPLPAERLPALAAQGIAGLAVDFAPGAPGSSRLVLAFDAEADAGSACAGGRAGGGPTADPPRLVAVYCEGAEPIAAVAGRAANASPAAVERLVWRATAQLFPDDYADSYGLNLFGFRVTLGGSVGF